MVSDVGRVYFSSISLQYNEIGNSVPITTNFIRPMFGSANVSTATTTQLALSTFSSMGSNAALWFALDGRAK